MKPSMRSFGEIDLVAYHLHELQPQQELAVRTAISLDPALAAESKAIAATLHMFDRQEYPTMIDTSVLDNHWLRLRPLLTPYRQRFRFAPWLFPAVSATTVVALLIIALWLVSMRSPSVKPSVTQQVASSPNLPATGRGGAGPTGPASTPPSVPTRGDESNRRAPVTQESPFGHISIPTLEPDSESAPPAGNIAFLSLPKEPLLRFLANTQPAAPVVSSSAVPPPPPAKHRHTQTDISLGVFGNFNAGRNFNEVQGSGSSTNLTSRSQSASPSIGIVGAFHQQFRPMFGYRVATSYTRTTFTSTQAYSNVIGALFYSARTSTSMHELTFAYTAQGPSSKRVSTDAEAGAGFLAFAPATPTASPDIRYNFRRAAVGGIGFSFHITPKLDVRTEYRALVYQAPSFRATNNVKYTVSSEPTVSVTYRFGSKK